MIGDNSRHHFDGSTADRAILPKYVKTLLEENGAGEASTAEMFCAAIFAYCNNVQGFRESHLWTILSARHVIEPDCCLAHSSLIVELRIAGLIS